MTSELILDSSAILDDIEHHFRVTAGPGSGKTYWLVGHVRRVAQLSSRLTPCSRIAVISYTNVAVREIQRRLDAAADVTEVSTIHSFLFRHVVRPYMHLLKDEQDNHIVSHNLVDTHSEHFVARDIIDAWLGDYGRRQLLMQPNNLELLKTRLRSIAVRIDEQDEPFLVPCKSEARDKRILDMLAPERLLNYKSRYWQRGRMDHEDVLYFAYRLLKKMPSLREFLSARFPYLLIDEFQDTLPVQAAVVRWLAENGTVVGVIGDPEQAIYGFLDASPSHFTGFRLPGFRAYSIDGNRRSTEAIVTFLNFVRSDGMKQQPIETERGAAPTAYFGNLNACLSHARSVSKSPDTMLVLARSHKNVIRARRADSITTAASWNSIEIADPSRSCLLLALASSTDLAQRGMYDLAIQRLVQSISSRKRFRSPLKYEAEVTIEKRRAVALSLLEFMVNRHADMITTSILDVYNELVGHIGTCLDGLSLPKAVRGKFCDEGSACLYSDLVHGLKTSDETRLTRTIHQAKGSEAEAVFVVLDDGEAEHILRPKAGQEEHRITYVALSRAKKELFIYCPEQDRMSDFAQLGLATVVQGEVRIRGGRTGKHRRQRKPRK